MKPFINEKCFGNHCTNSPTSGFAVVMWDAICSITMTEQYGEDAWTIHVSTRDGIENMFDISADDKDSIEWMKTIFAYLEGGVPSRKVPQDELTPLEAAIRKTVA